MSKQLASDPRFMRKLIDSFDLPEALQFQCLNTLVYSAAAVELGIKIDVVPSSHPKIKLTHNGKTLVISNGANSWNHRKEINVANNKYLTYQRLNQDNIPLPRYQAFNTQNIRRAYHSVKQFLAETEIPYPMVVKAFQGSSGDYVYIVENEDELFDKLKLMISQGRQYFLIEEFIAGAHYRIYTCQGKVIHIIERAKAFVVGDGVSTLSNLIETKNKTRFDYGCLPIKPVEELNTISAFSDLSGDEILQKGEKKILSLLANYNQGGESHNVDFAAIPEVNIQLLERVAKLSQLTINGIDLIIPDIYQPYTDQKCVINECNACPGVFHHYMADMTMKNVAATPALKMLLLD